MALEAPVLSIFDPPESGEGGIDPLSLQATYEHLAERIYPYMTVRMSRPRFLTAIAVGARVCEGLEEEVAADRETPAWLVYEWYIVEGFIRRRDRSGDGERLGIPGSMKVDRALRAARRLSAAAYLKTPKVFGFTGVYKRLGIGLEVISDDVMPDDGCFELLAKWEREQGLKGFLEGREGRGPRFRDDLRRAVEAGLRKGYTDRPAGWEGWDAIVEHLNPARPGRREADWLFDRLTDPDLRLNPRHSEATRMRRQIMLLLEASGRPLARREDESEFFGKLLVRQTGVSAELKERLDAIDAYEGLCGSD